MDAWLATWETLQRRDVEEQVLQRPPSPRAAIVDRFGNIHPAPEGISHTTIVREVPITHSVHNTHVPVPAAAPRTASPAKPLPAVAVQASPRRTRPLATARGTADAPLTPHVRSGHWEKSAPATWLALRLPSDWTREAPPVQRERERRHVQPRAVPAPSAAAQPPRSTLAAAGTACTLPVVPAARRSRPSPLPARTGPGGSPPVRTGMGVSRAAQSFAQLLQRDAAATDSPAPQTPTAPVARSPGSVAPVAPVSPLDASLQAARESRVLAPRRPRASVAAAQSLSSHALPLRKQSPPQAAPLLHPQAQGPLRPQPGVVQGTAHAARPLSAVDEQPPALRTRALSPTRRVATARVSTQSEPTIATPSETAPAAAAATPDTFSLLDAAAPLSLPVRDALAIARVQAVLGASAAPAEPPTARSARDRSTARIAAAEPPSSALEAAAVLEPLVQAVASHAAAGSTATTATGTLQSAQPVDSARAAAVATESAGNSDGAAPVSDLAFSSRAESRGVRIKRRDGVSSRRQRDASPTTSAE